MKIGVQDAYDGEQLELIPVESGGRKLDGTKGKVDRCVSNNRAG